MSKVTDNLADFGMRELGMAGKLLSAYASGKGQNNIPDTFGDDGVKLWMNTGSGNVFLADENSDVLMMNGDKLEQWHVCAYCGHEGFERDFQHQAVSDECSDEMRRVAGEEEEDEDDEEDGD